MASSPLGSCGGRHIDGLHIPQSGTQNPKRNRGGSTFCIADVPRWDFNWQQFYLLDQTLSLQAGDTLRVTCGYDTTSRTVPVTWGEGTQDEMCLNFFYVTQ